MSKLLEAAELLCLRLRDLEADEMFSDHDCGEAGCPVKGVKEAAAELREAIEGIKSPLR